MALSNLAEWADDKAASACGAACGASDRNSSEETVKEKPAACGAADKPAEDSASCGTALALLTNDTDSWGVSVPGGNYPPGAVFRWHTPDDEQNGAATIRQGFGKRFI